MQTACVHEGLSNHVTARGQVLFNLCKKSVVIIEIVTVAGVGLTLTTLMSPPRDSWGMKHFYGSDWSCHLHLFWPLRNCCHTHTGSHTPTTSSVSYGRGVEPSPNNCFVVLFHDFHPSSSLRLHTHGWAMHLISCTRQPQPYDHSSSGSTAEHCCCMCSDTGQLYTFGGCMHASRAYYPFCALTFARLI